jgi:imidazoleglycerol-phosphate dehydratase
MVFVYRVRSAAMDENPTGGRVALAAEGVANVSTGLPVLDHLVTELARAGRFKLALEVAPGGADEAVVAAGRTLGTAFGERIAATGAAGRGWSLVPADEALALAALERVPEPRLVTNVDFSDQRVGGLGTDVASRFLNEFAQAAGLNLHVRLVEGTDPQHVLAAIFKAVGAALGQACRPVPETKEDS